MITVTRLNGPAFALNPDLIERIEATPDTVIHLVGGTNYVVVETVDEIIASVRESRAAVIALSHLIDQRAAGVRVDPDFDQSYLNLARVYALEGASSKARAVLLDLLKQHPDHAQAKNMLAELPQ